MHTWCHPLYIPLYSLPKPWAVRELLVYSRNCMLFLFICGPIYIEFLIFCLFSTGESANWAVDLRHAPSGWNWVSGNLPRLRYALQRAYLCKNRLAWHGMQMYWSDTGGCGMHAIILHAKNFNFSFACTETKQNSKYSVIFYCRAVIFDFVVFFVFWYWWDDDDDIRKRSPREFSWIWAHLDLSGMLLL